MKLTLLLTALFLLVAVQDSDSEVGVDAMATSAKVNEWLINQARVERFVNQKLGGRIVNIDVMRRLRSEALSHLVRRQVIMEYLKTTRYYPRGGSAIEMRIDQLQKRLKQVNKNLQQHLNENGMSRAELDNEIAWEIAWQVFLDDWLSEERLDRYFQQRHREFDGTRMKVAHLLLRPAEEEHPDDVKVRADSIRGQISLGQLTWSGAVSDFSVAQTSIEQDGLVGWIEFTAPMPVEFNRAAFQLDPGQISSPVTTVVGIHLIKCLEIEPGSRGRQDIEPVIRAAATRSIFDQLSDQKRQDVDIQYDPPGR